MDGASAPGVTKTPVFTGKTCFAIMPYGDPQKDGPAGTGTQREHFDQVFDFISRSVTDLGIKPLRSDRHAEAVPIHSKMLNDIIDADLAIVDITGANPNVYYELGVRHTARRNCTLLIGYGETKPPFNITGIRVISYDLKDDASIKASMDALQGAIVANLSSRVTDSLVHAHLPGLNVSRPQQPLKDDREPLDVRLVLKNGQLIPSDNPTAGEKSFTLGVIKGDLVDVDLVDVWVNPESTRMEMARIHDDSVSAFIRYHGAQKDRHGNVKKDRIYDDLRRKIGTANVEPGWVIVTRPGDLKRVNVKAIFHVAAQHGEACNGYHTIRAYGSVISNALEKMDELNDSRWQRFSSLRSTRPLHSIIFPLLGTRSRDGDPIEVTESLVREARKYLTLWPETQIKSVYFLAYTQRDLELCEAAFQRLGIALPSSKSAATAKPASPPLTSAPPVPDIWSALKA